MPLDGPPPLTPDASTDLRQLCRQVALIIERRGHCRGEMVDDKGRVCLLGAVALAFGLDPKNGFLANSDWDPERQGRVLAAGAMLAEALKLSMADTLVGDWTVLTAWNDRTKREVVLARLMEVANAV